MRLGQLGRMALIGAAVAGRGRVRRVAARRRGEGEGRSSATTAWSAPRRRRAPRNGPRPRRRAPAASPATPRATPTPCTARRRWCSAAPTAMAAIPRSRGNAGLRARRPGLCRGARTRRTCCRAIPESWHFPSSANPQRSYTLLNREAPEFVRFINPSRLSRRCATACGACHIEIIEAAERSLMATGAMLWGGAAYNNGILPFKNYIARRGLYPRRRAGPDPARRSARAA